MSQALITKPRITAPRVDIICHPRNIAFMRKRLHAKPEVTPEEQAAFIKASVFAAEWNKHKHERIFIHEKVAEHCDTILALRKRHFLFHSLRACAKGLI